MLSVRKGKKCLCKDKTGTISRKRVVTRVMTIPQCTVEKSNTAAHSGEKAACSAEQNSRALHMGGQQKATILSSYSDFHLERYAIFLLQVSILLSSFNPFSLSHPSPHQHLQLQNHLQPSS